MTAPTRLTGNYRFGEHHNIRPGLILEVQTLTGSSDTDWRRADLEDLTNLVGQISGGAQEVVPVTNLRHKPGGSGKAVGASYTAYAVRDKLLPEGNEVYETWVAKGKLLHTAYGGRSQGLQAWHEWSESARNYDPAALDAKWFTFGDPPRGPAIPLGQGLASHIHLPEDYPGTGRKVTTWCWIHDPYQAYTFDRWSTDVGRLADDVRPGNMRIVTLEYLPPGFHVVEIRGQRGWYPLVMGEVKGSDWKFRAVEVAQAVAMGTHAVMSARGEF